MTADGSLPEGWRRVRFGDVVRQVKQTTKDPASDGLSRIVGLDHLDSESLPLQRWNELDDLPDGTSFTRVFRAGQVLFGKRRAYQRKVAVADFDGVCSGDILVFEPSTAGLLPEFLPYLVQSDGFFDHALGTSAGSLSPRTKWQELAKYEFPLPPPPLQRLHIELLAAADNVREQLDLVSEAVQPLVGSLIAEVANAGHESKTLASCCRSPISYGIVQPGLPIPDGVPFVNVEDMTAGPLHRSSLPTTTEEISTKHKRTLLEDGDVIVALRGPIGLATVIDRDLAGANLSRGVARLAPTKEVDPAYLAACMGSPYVRRQIERTATGSTFSELKIGALREVLVPVPPRARQRSIATAIEAALRVGLEASVTAERGLLLKRQLLTAVTEAPADV